MTDRHRYTFERKVNPGFEAGDFDLDKRGTRTFRMYTGDDGDYYSRRNTSRRERFNKNFIEKLNEATGHKLNPENTFVRKELRNVHEGLRSGQKEIHFEVTPRME